MRPVALALAAVLLAAPSAFANQTPETVLMDLDAFLKLYDASKITPDDPEDPKPPNAVTIPSARYDGQVVFDGDDPISAVFKGTISVNILDNDGWVRVTLLPDTVALRSATKSMYQKS